MEIKKGIPVSPGVAICPAVVIDAEDVRVPRRTIPASEAAAQRERLDHAIHAAKDELEQIRQEVEQELGPEPAKIFGFHVGMLQDPSLLQRAHDMIDRELVTAEFAFSTIMRQFADSFLAQPSSLFRERVSDVWDLEKRVLRHLMTDVRVEIEQLDEPAILIAHDLTPSQTAALNRSTIKGMATDLGGRTSHTAIVARAVGIPAVVGIESASGDIQSGQTVIIDGNRGLLIIDPDEEQLEEYRGHLERYEVLESELAAEAELPAVTLDGVEIDLLANIEFPDEIPQAVRMGAQGVGLYRTEFLFLSMEAEPSEDEQYEAFASAVEHVGGRPITIRTLDLGADKFTQRRMPEPEPNPFLGCRSIRLCLQDLDLFKTHLRAILRASAVGKVKVMFPLVSNTMELRQARMILNDVMEDLEEEGVPFDPDVPVGIMIEVPSAALMAKTFTREVDFFSIGTNDLIQYALAVDRTNERVANLFSSAHPAVLMLIKDVIRAAKRSGTDVVCCGEMAGEPDSALMLLGMGIRRLSMTPRSIPEIKRLVRSVTMEQCTRIARRAASYDSERQVTNYLREEVSRVLPGAFGGRSTG